MAAELLAHWPLLLTAAIAVQAVVVCAICRMAALADRDAEPASPAFRLLEGGLR